MSGKAKAIIPWAKVIKNPTDWINKECYPSGFKWAEPSKIHAEDAHDLLQHWRAREKSGKAPLIWNPSCDLLAGPEQRSGHSQRRRRRQSDPGSKEDSEEESFSTRLRHISENASESERANIPSPGPSRTVAGFSETDVGHPDHTSARHCSPMSEHGMYTINTPEIFHIHLHNCYDTRIYFFSFRLFN